MAKKSSKQSKVSFKKISRDNLKVSKIPSFFIGLGVVFGIAFGASYFFTKGVPSASVLNTKTVAKVTPITTQCKKLGGTTVIKTIKGKNIEVCTKTVTLTEEVKKNVGTFSLVAGGPLIDQYGMYAYETLINNQELMDTLQQFDPSFSELSMQVGSPNKIATLKNDQQIMLLIGCTAANCQGTVKAVAFDPKTQEVAILSEVSGNEQVTVSGTSNDQLIQLLLYFYLNPNS